MKRSHPMDCNFAVCILKCALSGLACFVCIVGSYTYADAKDSEMLTIQVRENQSIRDISRQYLRDPERWMDILKANGLTSAHEILPGMTLNIPAASIFQAIQALDDSKKLIQDATRAGARIFAHETIARAIQLRDDAIEKRQAGDWDRCTEIAREASEIARQALDISLDNQNIPAEAVVQFLQGNVHTRKSSENEWRHASKFDILTEGERIRTLSQSSVDILFRDESLLHLKENAQALIRKIRTNLLEDTQEASVSLIKGDVFALLGPEQNEKQLQFDMPGIETKIQSRQFWIGKDDQGTRFANYDGEIQITSSGASVLLKKNQGSVVPHNDKPLPPKDLLPAPELRIPQNGHEQRDIELAFSWSPIPGAIHYRLEFSTHESFSDNLWSHPVKDISWIFPEYLGYGIFYWRVTAVSSDKLPGTPSEIRYFRITDLKSLPYVVISSPKEGAILTDTPTLITGQTQDGILLTFRNEPLTVEPDGNFRFDADLIEGENIITVMAVNRAGVEREIRRKVIFVPDQAVGFSFDPTIFQAEPDYFISAQNRFTLSGKTVPNAYISLSSVHNAYTATAFSDEFGKFKVDVQLFGSKGEFQLQAITMAGKTCQHRFSVEVDNTPPEIRFAKELPSLTSQKSLTVQGIAVEATSFTLDGKPIQLSNGSFQTEIELIPGKNSLRFEARDRVHNARIIEKEIFRDSDAPELVNYRMTPKKVKGGETVTLWIQAKDATGLARIAQYSLEIGDYTHNGILILSDNQYTGSFRVPADLSGHICIKHIQLSDYLGSTQKYSTENMKASD